MVWVFDCEGGFFLIYKDIGKVIWVVLEEGKQVLLVDYDLSKFDDSVIWYELFNKGRYYYMIYNGILEIVMYVFWCMKCDFMELCFEGEVCVKENILVVFMKDWIKKEDFVVIVVN